MPSGRPSHNAGPIEIPTALADIDGWVETIIAERQTDTARAIIYLVIPLVRGYVANLESGKTQEAGSNLNAIVSCVVKAMEADKEHSAQERNKLLEQAKANQAKASKLDWH